MNKKFISLLLLAAVAMSSMAACSESTSETNQNTSAETKGTADVQTSVDETEAETENSKLSDQLAEANYNGTTFYISTFQNANFHYEVDAEEMTAVPINDAIWERNNLIEEKYNIVIEQVLNDDWSNYSNVRTAIEAGDSTVSLSVMRCGNDLAFWKDNLVYTYDNIPGIDLTKPYWDKGLNDSLSIGGYQYTAVGAANLDIYDLTFCLLFNKQMITNNQLESPYTLVNEGRWTFDKMAEYMEIAKSDKNGDGQMTLDDIYGYTSAYKMTTPGFWIAGDVMSIGKDENDMPYVAFGEEAFLNVFEKTFEVVWDTNASYMTEDGLDIPNDCRTLFMNGNAMFMDMSFYYIEQMRDSDTDFGIIPYPKYNEEQENVRCRVCYYMPYIVSGVSENVEMTGTILEAMHCYSYEEVIPVYYDICLKSKNARDEESQEMLDLIFASRVIDIGDSTLCGQLRDNFMAAMMRGNKRNLASAAAVYSKGILKNLEDAIPDLQ